MVGLGQGFQPLVHHPQHCLFPAILGALPLVLLDEPSQACRRQCAVSGHQISAVDQSRRRKPHQTRQQLALHLILSIEGREIVAVEKGIVSRLETLEKLENGSQQPSLLSHGFASRPKHQAHKIGHQIRGRPGLVFQAPSSDNGDIATVERHSFVYEADQHRPMNAEKPARSLADVGGGPSRIGTDGGGGVGTAWRGGGRAASLHERDKGKRCVLLARSEIVADAKRLNVVAANCELRGAGNQLGPIGIQPAEKPEQIARAQGLLKRLLLSSVGHVVLIILGISTAVARATALRLS